MDECRMGLQSCVFCWSTSCRPKVSWGAALWTGLQGWISLLFPVLRGMCPSVCQDGHLVCNVIVSAPGRYSTWIPLRHFLCASDGVEASALPRVKIPNTWWYPLVSTHRTALHMWELQQLGAVPPASLHLPSFGHFGNWGQNLTLGHGGNGSAKNLAGLALLPLISLWSCWLL